MKIDVLALGFQPIEDMEPSTEMKRAAALHAAARVPAADLPDILAMFGLIDPPKRAAEPYAGPTCRNGHPHPNNLIISPKGYKRCRTCERNHRTGENR
jgi:hypothetical protein